jgi:hypothetical protein
MGAVQEAAIRDERRMDRGGKPVVESLPEPPCGIGRTSGKRKKNDLAEGYGQAFAYPVCHRERRFL